MSFKNSFKAGARQTGEKSRYTTPRQAVADCKLDDDSQCQAVLEKIIIICSSYKKNEDM